MEFYFSLLSQLHHFSGYILSRVSWRVRSFDVLFFVSRQLSVWLSLPVSANKVEFGVDSTLFL